MRRFGAGLVLALVAGLAAPAALPVAAASNAKVVIIVGADTPQYLDDANQVYAEAIKHTPNVIRVYSPNATWSAVKSATTGANVVVYFGHGNGWPSPYTYDPKYTTKDGFGLNASAAGTHGNLQYYGEPSIRTLNLAPNAIIFLHHLCYASGNSEPKKPAPTLATAKARVDNYGSAFLAAGASVVIADGHSHDPYYLRALFTTGQTIESLWRNAPNFHDNVISFDPSRSTGMALMDPENTPGSFYRSIVGNLATMTHHITGTKLPPGVRGEPGAVTVGGRSQVTGGTMIRATTPLTSDGVTLGASRVSRPAR